MPCSGRFAEAWQFAAFWCVGSVLYGADDSGGAGNASLQDLSMNFPNSGIQANVGMVLYNLTTGLSGEVTAVSTNALTATGVTWSNGDLYRIVAITGSEISAIEMHLDIAAGDLHVALAATDSCSCTWQAWVTGYLAKLNIIDAAAFYDCPCGSPNDPERKQSLLDWMAAELEKVRLGQYTFCEGDTGVNYPAVGWAEIGHTAWNEADIIRNRIMRGIP